MVPAGPSPAASAPPRSFPGAETAKQKYDEANQQDQANSAAAIDGAAKVKSAAAEQEKKNNDQE